MAGDTRVAETTRVAEELKSKYFMYSGILVAIDNSPYSSLCSDAAVSLARAFNSSVTGFHVFAAQLHQERFREMETTLPPQFREPSRLDQQREKHRSLIHKGLEMISYSYLEPLAQRCRSLGVPYSSRVAEGKNYLEVVREASEGDYDLLVLGAQGLGARDDGQLGSVCERVARRLRKDVLVVKRGAFPGGAVLSGVDGSVSSQRAFQTAATLGDTFHTPIELVSVYDPELHRMAFSSLASTLSGDMKRMFSMDGQGKLHDEAIDSGLAEIYRGYLEAAQRQVEGAGRAVRATLLAGKPSSSILQHLRASGVSLVVLGRFGRHCVGDLDIGSTTEYVLRQAPCHVLITSN